MWQPHSHFKSFEYWAHGDKYMRKEERLRYRLGP